MFFLKKVRFIQLNGAQSIVVVSFWLKAGRQNLTVMALDWSLLIARVKFVRWPTSVLRIPNDTPNSRPHSEFQNLTPNSKSSLRILKPHSKF